MQQEGCARLERQPRGLQVHAIQKAVVLGALSPEMARDKGVVAERGSPHGEALALRRQGPVPYPDKLSLCRQAACGLKFWVRLSRCHARLSKLKDLQPPRKSTLPA